MQHPDLRKRDMAKFKEPVDLKLVVAEDERNKRIFATNLNFGIANSLKSISHFNPLSLTEMPLIIQREGWGLVFGLVVVFWLLLSDYISPMNRSSNVSFHYTFFQSIQ